MTVAALSGDTSGTTLRTEFAARDALRLLWLKSFDAPLRERRDG
jgi:hypothetical protein